MVTAMSIRDINAAGFERGWNIASWQDMPAIGATLPRETDWIGIETVETVSEQIEAWEMLCDEAETHGRQFSPFEFTAAAINARDEKYGEGASEAGWEAFEAAIARGRDAYRRKAYPLRMLRRAALETA